MCVSSFFPFLISKVVLPLFCKSYIIIVQKIVFVNSIKYFLIKIAVLPLFERYYFAVIFAIKIELSLPYFIQDFQSERFGPHVCIHSAAVTHASVGEMFIQPKLPRRAPRSGTAIFSVERIRHIFPVSNSAIKSGAR